MHVLYMLLDLLYCLLNMQLMVEEVLQCCAKLHIQALYFTVTSPTTCICMSVATVTKHATINVSI